MFAASCKQSAPVLLKYRSWQILPKSEGRIVRKIATRKICKKIYFISCMNKVNNSSLAAAASVPSSVTPQQPLRDPSSVFAEALRQDNNTGRRTIADYIKSGLNIDPLKKYPVKTCSCPLHRQPPSGDLEGNPNWKEVKSNCEPKDNNVVGHPPKIRNYSLVDVLHILNKQSNNN